MIKLTGLIIVLLLTVFVDIIQALGIIMVIAALLLMKRSYDYTEADKLKKLDQNRETDIPGKNEKDVSSEIPPSEENR